MKGKVDIKVHFRYQLTDAWTSGYPKEPPHLPFHDDPSVSGSTSLFPETSFFSSFVLSPFCLTLFSLPCNLCHFTTYSCPVPWPCSCSSRSELLELLPDPDSRPGFLSQSCLPRGFPGSLLWRSGAVSVWLNSPISAHKTLVDSIFPEVQSVSQFQTWKLCLVSKCSECILPFHVIIPL